MSGDGDSIASVSYRENLAERIFLATISEASSDLKLEGDYAPFAKFWGSRCLRMAEGFIDALLEDRERQD